MPSSAFDLSIVFSTFGQPRMLSRWFDRFLAQPEKDRSRVQVIVVDDCGTPKAATPVSESISLYRINVDRPWNQGEARNLGAIESVAPIILLIDVDMTFPQGMLGLTLDSIRSLQKGSMISPILRHEGDKKFDASSPNVHLMHKSDFVGMKGYELAYCGHKGWSDVELQHVMEKRLKRIRTSTLWMWLHHDDPDIRDAQVKTLNRDCSHNRALHLKRMGVLKHVGVDEFVALHHSPMIQSPWSKQQ